MTELHQLPSEIWACINLWKMAYVFL